MNHVEVVTEIAAHWREDFSLERALVALFRVGSHSHGTYIPPEDPEGFDDTDYMIVLAPPARRVVGLRRWEHWTIQENGLDVVAYEWRKFVSLLLKSNPNVVGTLWLDGEDWWAPPRSPFFGLRHFRTDICSKRLVTAFVGYAQGQLYKMEHFAHQGYMGAKRKELVSRFGYDVKNAAHMIRLLRMCREFLETGTLVVRRPDAAELIAIKRGAWTLDEVKREADGLIARVRELEQASTIQDHPDAVVAENILLRGYFAQWDFTRRADLIAERLPEFVEGTP